MENDLLTLFKNERDLKLKLVGIVEAKMKYIQKLLADFKRETRSTFQTLQYEFGYDQDYHNPRSEKDGRFRLDFRSGTILIGRFELKLRVNAKGHLERSDKLNEESDEENLDLREDANLVGVQLWELESANQLLDSFHSYWKIELAKVEQSNQGLERRNKWENA